MLALLALAPGRLSPQLSEPLQPRHDTKYSFQEPQLTELVQVYLEAPKAALGSVRRSGTSLQIVQVGR